MEAVTIATSLGSLKKQLELRNSMKHQISQDGERTQIEKEHRHLGGFISIGYAVFVLTVYLAMVLPSIDWNRIQSDIKESWRNSWREWEDHHYRLHRRAASTVDATDLEQEEQSEARLYMYNEFTSKCGRDWANLGRGAASTVDPTEIQHPTSLLYTPTSLSHSAQLRPLILMDSF
jgi:hypothetical protein